MKISDEQLEILIKKHLKPIYNFVYRYVGSQEDAEDITQETFLKMWRKFKKYKKDKSFKAWLFAIARNTAIDKLRKKKSFVFSDFDTEEGENLITDNLADDAPLPPEIFENKELAVALAEAIEKLPPRYREIILLRKEADFTFREIAESLGEPLDTVKSRYRRGLHQIMSLLRINN